MSQSTPGLPAVLEVAAYHNQTTFALSGVDKIRTRYPSAQNREEEGAGQFRSHRGVYVSGLSFRRIDKQIPRR